MGKVIAYPSVAKCPRTLAARRHLKMAPSAHAYVGGSTVSFYEWLGENGANAVPLTRDEAVSAAQYLARVVGKAHARQMDAATWREFRQTLRAHRSKCLASPSWRWSSAVDLAAPHKSGLPRLLTDVCVTQRS